MGYLAQVEVSFLDGGEDCSSIELGGGRSMWARMQVDGKSDLSSVCYSDG